MSTIKEDVQFILSKDCPVQKQSKMISLAGTVVFWLLLLLCAAIIPAAKPKEKYKTVQIVLSSPEKKIVKKSETPAAQKPSAAPKQEQAAKTVEQPVTPPPSPVPAKVEQPKVEQKPAPAKTTQKTQTQPKTAPKTESKPVPAKTPVKQAEPVEYAMDMSDGVNFNAPVTKKTAAWRDEMFDEDDAATSSQSTEAKTVTAKSGVAGTAGTQSTTTTSKTTSTQSNNTNTNSNVSSDVKNSLGAIADAKVNNNSITAAGTSNVKALVDNGEFKWADGRARNMWYPDSPDIKISPENSPGMSMDIEITFTVTDNGTVTNIQFVQSALLSEGLKGEIRKQISKWLFDEAEVSSNAKFLLKIRTK